MKPDNLELNARMTIYQELKADVRNYDTMLWQLPLYSLGLLTLAGSLIQFKDATSEFMVLASTMLSLFAFTIWHFVARQELYRQNILKMANHHEITFGSPKNSYDSPDGMASVCSHWWECASSISMAKLLFLLIFVLGVASTVFYSLKCQGSLILVVVFALFILYFAAFVVLAVRAYTCNKKQSVHKVENLCASSGADAGCKEGRASSSDEEQDVA